METNILVTLCLCYFQKTVNFMNFFKFVYNLKIYNEAAFRSIKYIFLIFLFSYIEN